jgi:hypothetical protein
MSSCFPHINYATFPVSSRPLNAAWHTQINLIPEDSYIFYKYGARIRKGSRFATWRVLSWGDASFAEEKAISAWFRPKGARLSS